MKIKHALWVAAANGNSVSVTSPEKIEALTRWNTVALCERFGWTPETVGNLPVDLYQDIIAILAVKDAASHSKSHS